MADEKRFEVRRERATDGSGFKTGKAGQYYIIDTHISDRVIFYPQEHGKEENTNVARHLEGLYQAELAMQANPTGHIRLCADAQKYHYHTRELRMLGDHMLEDIGKLNLEHAKRNYILLGAELDTVEADAITAWEHAQGTLWQLATDHPGDWLPIEILRRHDSEGFDAYRWRVEDGYLAVVCVDAEPTYPLAIIIRRQPKKYKDETSGYQLAAVEAEKLARGLRRLAEKPYGPKSLPKDLVWP